MRLRPESKREKLVFAIVFVVIFIAGLIVPVPFTKSYKGGIVYHTRIFQFYFGIFDLFLDSWIGSLFCLLVVLIHLAVSFVLSLFGSLLCRKICVSKTNSKRRIGTDIY